jgi:hypothetical protein
MYGLNGFVSNHGSIFTNNETFYGFSNSHVSLLHVLNSSEFEVMLQRNLNNDDGLGIGWKDPMEDDYLTTFEQIHFTETSADQFLKTNIFLNDQINNWVQVSNNGWELKGIANLSGVNDEIEFVDLDLENDRYLITLRNRMPYPVNLYPKLGDDLKLQSLQAEYLHDKFSYRFNETDSFEEFHPYSDFNLVFSKDLLKTSTY